MPKDLPAQLSPKERLAKSREAIAASIGGHDREEPNHDDLGAEWGQDVIGEHVKPNGKPRSGWWPVFSSLAKTWWHRHPLNAVAHMARPVVSSYARRSPAKLIGAAALVGVVIVIARPWRLISAGALLAAALRPSEISAFAMTMLASFNSTLQKDKEQRQARGRDA
ncbi:MAG: hypothetical protein EOO28_34180 [Comamonadaceae bacterium]|nr:MAG: hypothetical protein EOO28_34180 [Comamonadaceae bacterium]